MGGKLDSLPPQLPILSGDSVFDNQWVSRSLLELELELLVMIRYVVKEIDDGLPVLIALNDHSGDEPPKSRLSVSKKIYIYTHVVHYYIECGCSFLK